MVLFMNYRRNNKSFSVAGRGKYFSTSILLWPTGYYYEKCECTYYYFMKSKNCYRCVHCVNG